MQKSLRVFAMVSILAFLIALAGCTSGTSNSAISAAAPAVTTTITQINLNMNSVVMSDGVAFIPLDIEGDANDPGNAQQVIEILRQFKSNTKKEIVSWTLVIQPTAYMRSPWIEGICITYK